MKIHDGLENQLRMQDAITLSVVVCTFNRSNYLIRLLNSLREALVPEDLSCEFIVVDNNSDDQTRRVLREYNEYCEPKLRYVFEPEVGLSNARNRGIREAKGQIIAFTDDDVIVDRYWMQNIIKAFKEHVDVACVGGKILPIWEGPKPNWLKTSWYDYLALLDYGDSVVYMNTPNIWGANLAVKSEVFRKYGLFDINLGRKPGKLYGFEETDFLQRIRNAGDKLLYYPLSVVYHNVPANRMSKNYFRKWKFDQGELEGLLTGDAKYKPIMNVHSIKPLLLVKQIVVSLLKIGCFTKDRLDHELRLCQILGYLSGRLKQMNLAS